jgi:hypothetical protein
MAKARYWNWVTYVDGTNPDVSTHQTKAEGRQAAKDWVNRTNRHTGAKVEKVEFQERLSNGGFSTIEVFRP